MGLTALVATTPKKTRLVREIADPIGAEFALIRLGLGKSGSIIEWQTPVQGVRYRERVLPESSCVRNIYVGAL